MANFGSEAHKGATVQITGLNKVLKALRDAGDDLEDMRDLNHRLGQIVINNASVPKDSGEVAGTLRAGRGRTKAVVRAGYKSRGSYAGVLHYGDPHRGHAPHPFLTDSLRASQGQIMSELTKGIDLLLSKNGLK